MSTPGDPLNGADAENPTPEGPVEEEIIDLQKMWDEYEDTSENGKNFNFFQAIELAKDGGMSEASELIGTGRYLTGVLPIVFVLMNVYALLVVNITFLSNGADGEPLPAIFMITQNFILAALGVSKDQVNAAEIVAYIEIFLITWYVGRIFYWAYFIRFPGSHDMHRWQAVQELFWNAVPDCSTISSVKMLNFVTPAVIIPDLIDLITTSGSRLVPNAIGFVVFRAIALIVGFDSLLFKLQVNTELVVSQNTNFGFFTTFIPCVTFLNQILGVVQVSWFVRKRIFQFIFAGEDGVMSAEEEALKETWESMLAERIWRELSWHQALAAYLTYNDYDFQKLALETVTEGNAEKMASKASKKSMRAQRSADRAKKALSEQAKEMELTDQS